MRRGLVGDHRRGEAHPPERGKDVRRVADQRDAERLALRRGVAREPHRLGRVVDDHVAIAHADAPLRPRRVDLDGDAHAAGHLHRERLRAAHAAEPGGEHDPPAEVAGREALARRREGLVGALEDALRADIGPGAGRVLAVHDQALGLERAVDRPGRPLADEVGVGGEHLRRHGVGAEHRHRLARLDHQRLVVAERLQRRDDGVETLPVPRRPPRAAIDDQLGRLLAVGDGVLEHPEDALLPPPLAAERIAAGAARPGCWRGSSASDPPRTSAPRSTA